MSLTGMLQHFFELMHGRLPVGYAVVRNIWISAVMPLPLGATPAPANNSREMEERQFIESSPRIFAELVKDTSSSQEFLSQVGAVP